MKTRIVLSRELKCNGAASKEKKNHIPGTRINYLVAYQELPNLPAVMRIELSTFQSFTTE